MYQQWRMSLRGFYEKSKSSKKKELEEMEKLCLPPRETPKNGKEPATTARSQGITRESAEHSHRLRRSPRVDTLQTMQRNRRRKQVPRRPWWLGMHSLLPQRRTGS